MTSWPELEDMLYRSITGGRSPRTETFHQALSELRRAAGSTAELARRLGRPVRTVGGWLTKGITPRSEAARLDVLQALRRHRLRLGREARLRRGHLHVVAKMRYRRKGQPEDIREWSHPPAGGTNIQWGGAAANGAVLDAYLDGDMAAAAIAFINGIGDDTYREMTSPDNDDDDVHFDLMSIDLE